jgi:hypothetical protein
VVVRSQRGTCVQQLKGNSSSGTSALLKQLEKIDNPARKAKDPLVYGNRSTRMVAASSR